jgi:hypothetical protein
MARDHQRTGLICGAQIKHGFTYLLKFKPWLARHLLKKSAPRTKIFVALRRGRGIVMADMNDRHSWEFRKERFDEKDGQVHLLYRCRRCGLYRRVLKGNVSFGFASVAHYLRKGEVFPDGSPKWLKDRPGCGASPAAWSLVRRVVDEYQTPWDEFVSANGALLKRESRDCFDGKGRLAAHPMRQYARASDPEVWVGRVQDLGL